MNTDPLKPGYLLWVGIFLLQISCMPSSFGKNLISLIAVGTDRVVLELDGERIVLSKQEPVSNGVALLHSDGSNVTVLHLGSELTLNVDSHSALIYAESQRANQIDRENKTATLWADSSGFFFAEGQINGHSIHFLVDTGADIVTLSSTLADRIGINYQSGKDGYASTASGIAPLKTVYLEKLTVAGITQYDIQISVVSGHFPDVPLLGGTFLNHLNMSRVGNKMELTAP